MRSAKNKLVAVSLYLLPCFIAGSFLTLQESAAADDAKIYRWKDASGQTHYSTTPQHNGQSEADLPDIRREDLSGKIKFLKQITPQSCAKSGGIDCSLGPDSGDGSVICLDGSKDSEEKFEEFCTKSSLESGFYLEYANEPLMRKHSEVFPRRGFSDTRTPTALVLEIRNLSGVDADDVEVYFRIPYVHPSRFPAEGPKEIQAFGVGSYRVPVAELPERVKLQHLSETVARISCSNCSKIRQK